MKLSSSSLINRFLLVLFINSNLAFAALNYYACLACPHFYDYDFSFLPFNKKCEIINIDPVYSRLIAFVKNDVELHKVTTSDGYILDVFRMQNHSPKGVIVLQHPFITDSSVWLSHGNQSLALIYWKLGYDVWLPNNRGTNYAQSHEWFNEKGPGFWNFSFHEMGLYDHPAVIDYIYKKTEKKLIFIGHSMSSTTSLIYASMFPQDAEEKLKIIVATAPIAHLKHVQGLVKLFAPFYPILKLTNQIFRSYSFFNLKLLRFAPRLQRFTSFKLLKVIVMSLISGWTPMQFDPLYIIVISNLLSAQAWKTLYHFIQLYESNNKFQMYDYGTLKNLEIYKQAKPLSYPIENITVPVYLVSSSSDYLSTQKDVDYLFNKLQVGVKRYGRLNITGLNHIDYHFGKDRFKLVWNNVTNLLQTLN